MLKSLKIITDRVQMAYRCIVVLIIRMQTNIYSRISSSFTGILSCVFCGYVAMDKRPIKAETCRRTSIKVYASISSHCAVVGINTVA